MAKIVGYIGCSIDGFIVDAQGNMDWLYTHGAGEYGKFDFNKFIKTIGTIVMGRTTYDWLISNTKEWPYRDHQSIVVTSTDLISAPANIVGWHQGLKPLVAYIGALPGKNAWVCGGGRLQSTLLELDALDYLEVFIVPVLIGGGTRLWPGSQKSIELELDHAGHVDNGIVRLAYRRKT